MTAKNSITELNISLVFPNPNQPRKDFDQDKLEELAMSINEYGVLEPIVVTPRDGRFMIIAGERRYRASLLAGQKTIPARVIEADDALVEELALLENIQRQDLNIIEEAKAYQALLNRGWSKEDLAKKMGFKQVWRIDERLNLLNLTPEYQYLVIRGEISNSQAFEMSRVSSEKQKIILKRILSGELNNYNKLRAFVDGLIALENQETIFDLGLLSEEEKTSIDKLIKLLRNIEQLIGEVQEKHLRKTAIHSDITAERINYLIQFLMKIRKSVLAGQGIKDAMQEAA